MHDESLLFPIQTGAKSTCQMTDAKFSSTASTFHEDKFIIMKQTHHEIK